MVNGIWAHPVPREQKHPVIRRTTMLSHNRRGSRAVALLATAEGAQRLQQDQVAVLERAVKIAEQWASKHTWS